MLALFLFKPLFNTQYGSPPASTRSPRALITNLSVEVWTNESHPSRAVVYQHPTSTNNVARVQTSILYQHINQPNTYQCTLDVVVSRYMCSPKKVFAELQLFCFFGLDLRLNEAFYALNKFYIF